MSEVRDANGRFVTTDSETAKLRGRIGGLKRVPKGISKLSPERRREIARLGVEARRRKREEALQGN